MLFIIILFAVAVSADVLLRSVPVVTIFRDRRFKYWIETAEGRKRKKTIRPRDAHLIPIGTHTSAHLSASEKAFIGRKIVIHDTDGTVTPLCVKPYYLFETGEKISYTKRVFPICTMICAAGVLLVLALAPILRTSVVTPLFEEITYVEESGTHWWPEESPEEQRIHNILLIGTDGRAAVEGARADAMFLVSFNEDLACIKLITLQRDLRVEAYDPYLVTFNEYVKQYGLTEDDPDYAMKQKMLPKTKYVTGKLNACFTFQKNDFPAEMTEEEKQQAAYISGCESLLFNIEKVFNLYIDGYMVTDMESITHFIDAVGGMNYTVPNEEYRTELEKLTLAHNEWYGFDDHFDSTGETHLTGGMFLSYFRLRHVDNWSDTERTARQRALIAALAEQKFTADTALQTLQDMDIDLVKKAFNGMYTNIDSAYMESLYSLLFKGYTLDFDNMLPRRNEYAEITVYHTEYIVVPDWFTPLSEQTKEVIYGAD